jgi:hypothetical protein
LGKIDNIIKSHDEPTRKENNTRLNLFFLINPRANQFHLGSCVVWHENLSFVNVFPALRA